MECSQDSQCGVASPACDADGECVQCTNDSFCSGTRSVCNLERQECQAPCADNGDCGNKSPFCDALTGRCNECENDQNCDNDETCNTREALRAVLFRRAFDAFSSFGSCPSAIRGLSAFDADPAIDFECVECGNDADCPVAAPLCDAKNKCQLCSDGDNRGCSGDTPFCDDGKECAQCLEDPDCANNENCNNGKCVPD